MSRPSRLMIVDDQPAEQMLLRTACATAEWDVTIDDQRSGQEAINALRRNHADQTPTDLVLLACYLQGTTCIDTLRIIRNHPGLSHQPIIVFSSTPILSEVIQTCYMLGVLKCLERPGDTTHLVQMVSEIKAHFSDDGSLTPRGPWVNSSRLAVVREMNARMEPRVLAAARSAVP
jgi:CheY-like chemotaxis protein